MTKRFKDLLRWQRDPQGRPLTQDLWARWMVMGRTRLCQTLGNVAGRGGVNRPKVAGFITEHFGEDAEEMLAELGWDKEGNLTPGGTFHVEQI